MYAVALLIVVATLSLLITRIASVMLTSTGMSQEAARFQARSALSGVGFTTAEAERVVRHPVRRRIIMTLMLIGNAGLVTAIAALLGGFLGTGGLVAVGRAALVIGGMVALYALSRSSWVDQRLTRLIERVLSRYPDLDVRDYARLLRVTGEYSVHEMPISAGDWIAGRPLGELRLPDEGVMVLGIQRADGDYLGVPTRDSVLRAEDVAVLYGHEEAVRALAERRSGAGGDEAHRSGVAASRARDEREDEGSTRERP